MISTDSRFPVVQGPRGEGLAVASPFANVLMGGAFEENELVRESDGLDP